MAAATGLGPQPGNGNGKSMVVVAAAGVKVEVARRKRPLAINEIGRPRREDLKSVFMRPRVEAPWG